MRDALLQVVAAARSALGIAPRRRLAHGGGGSGGAVRANPIGGGGGCPCGRAALGGIAVRYPSVGRQRGVWAEGERASTATVLEVYATGCIATGEGREDGPSLRGELPLLPSLLESTSSFWDCAPGCCPATDLGAGWGCWEEEAAGWVSCFDLGGGDTSVSVWGRARAGGRASETVESRAGTGTRVGSGPGYLWASVRRSLVSGQPWGRAKETMPTCVQRAMVARAGE